MTENSIFTIQPYKINGLGCWVFDDEARGLKAEAFVCGMSEIIDEMLKKAKINKTKAKKGFTLLFSHIAFPKHDFKLEHDREEAGGNWYKVEEIDQEGWLCPALFKYFPAAPKELYGKAVAN